MTDVAAPIAVTAIEGAELQTAEQASLPTSSWCRAVVLGCVESRSVEPTHRFRAGHGLAGGYAMVWWPGGALALATSDRPALLDTLDAAQELHHPTEIHLMVHHDCGRIGGSALFPGRLAETATLDTALRMAAEVIAERFPELEISLGRLDPDGPPRDRSRGAHIRARCIPAGSVAAMNVNTFTTAACSPASSPSPDDGYKGCGTCPTSDAARFTKSIRTHKGAIA